MAQPSDKKNLERWGVDASSVERYLAGEMPQAERSAFETRMASDATLSDEVAAERLIQGSLVQRSLAPLSGNTAPSSALLGYLTSTAALSTAPAKRNLVWALALTIFVIGLGSVVYLTGQNDAQAPAPQLPRNVAVDTVHHAQQAQSPVATMDTIQLLTNKPVTAKAEHSSTETQPQKPQQQLDEPLGPPKVYTNDSLKLKIHSK